jgi:hypothetical protein
MGRKQKSFFKKHGVSFEEAVTIFNDPNILSVYDKERSEFEDRWLSIGISAKIRILVIVHLFLTMDKNKSIIRLISARKATQKEIKAYKTGIR